MFKNIIRAIKAALVQNDEKLNPNSPEYNERMTDLVVQGARMGL